MNNITNSQKHEPILFNSYDYILFSLMLGLSCLIGIWFGCKKKQATRAEYLFGGKQMKKLPISLSLVASQVSGITVLAAPVDVYTFGVHYVLASVAGLLTAIAICFIYAPIFYKLQVTSVYECLELRFNSKLRVLGSVLYTLCSILFLSFVVYIPVLAFAHVSAVNVHWVSMILCAICVFYTTIGGLRAVVWTDTLQIGMMVAAILLVLGMGIHSAGGFGEVWSKASRSGRLTIDFDLNPTKTDTFYAAFVGSLFTIHYLMVINQSYIQRYIALPTITDVKWVVLYLGIGYSLFTILSVLTGLTIYAKYADCDPLSSGQISKQDQILPYFVMDVSKAVPGLAGLFISGLFSGALSTLSSYLNSLSGTIYEDLIKSLLRKNISEKAASNIMKLITLVLGIIVLVLSVLVEKIGDIMPVLHVMIGTTSGPLLGIFILGMLCPRVNSKGTLIGAITSTIVMSYIIVQALLYQTSGIIKRLPKPISIDGCLPLVNITIAHTSENTTVNTFEPFFIFRLSHYYYTGLGFLLMTIISVLASLIFKSDDKVVSKDLIAPMLHWAMKREKLRNDYEIVETTNTQN